MGWEQGQQETVRPDHVPGVTQKPSLTQTHIRGHCQLLSAGFTPWAAACTESSISRGKALTHASRLPGCEPAQTPAGRPGTQAGCLEVSSVHFLFLCSQIPLANAKFSRSYILSRVSRSVTATSHHCRAHAGPEGSLPSSPALISLNNDNLHHYPSPFFRFFPYLYYS